MAQESQGVIISRGASTYASTQITGNGLDGIKFVAGTTSINNTAGNFTGEFTTTMEFWSNSSANPGPWYAKTVAATVISMYQPIAHTTNSTAFILYGREMGAIGEVTSFNVLTGAAAVIDITNLGSTAKEKMIGIRDEGQFTFEVMFNQGASAQAGIITDLKERRKSRFAIALTDASGAESPTKISFGGFVLSAPITGAVDNALKRNVTIEIATAVDWLNRT